MACRGRRLWRATLTPPLCRRISYLTRLSYTELQPGSSHGSGAEHPEAVVVSTGSERLFHMADDQPFAQTHDHGLKRKLQADTHPV